jgi:hypothetical protein
VEFEKPIAEFESPQPDSRDDHDDGLGPDDVDSSGSVPAQAERGATPGGFVEIEANSVIDQPAPVYQGPTCDYRHLKTAWEDYLNKTILPEFSNGAWPQAEKEAKVLEEFADEEVGKLIAEMAIGRVNNGMFGVNGSREYKEIDVVISGGGNYDGYALGVGMVLSRLHQWLEVKRWGGTSGGGQMGFEFALRQGLEKSFDTAVLRARLGWDELRKKERKNNWAPGCFCSCAEDGILQAFIIREVQSEWLMRTYSSQFPLLDRVALGLTCLQLGEQLTRVENFSNDEDARNAFIATRAGYTHNYKDMPCSDGATLANKLLFQDKVRDQVIVDISSDAVPYVLEDEDLTYPGKSYLKLIELGIEDGVYFFHHGTLQGSANHATKSSGLPITICRQGQDVASNECLASPGVAIAPLAPASAVSTNFGAPATIAGFVDAVHENPMKALERLENEG